jgi:2-methylisocitrate lyase-like PEP mutase family enzyme
MSPQRERAERFRKLHFGPPILVLPNAWDAASARIFEEEGFPAIATTSAGVANALGYPDGERVPFAEMLDAIARICRSVRVPVTADIEAGFATSPEAVAENCRAVLAAGAVGVNLEDSIEEHSLVESDVHAEKVRAARGAAAAFGVPLVINARTDAFLADVGALPTRLPETIRRCKTYRAAGADSFFVPAVTDAPTIEALVRGIDGPVNVLAGPGTPPVAELERLGVARLSTGSAPMRSALAHVRRIATELRSRGTYRLLTEDTISYAEANRLFEPRP